jgi:exonuclease SbcC
MIFSQIFSPNYKSSDPEKRILSIEKLNEDAEKDKSILHELAFNDASDLVSLAALNKLNSFVLWMKSAETSHSPRIRKQAQQICQSQLEDETIVSDKLFLAFVTESKNKPLLEQLLFSSKRLQAHDTMALDILFSLNNVNHLRRFFQEYASASQQMLIVEKTQDVKTLSRISKYAKDLRVTVCIDDKIANIAIMAKKPLKIKQQVTMINSRLLALKEAHEYEYLRTQLAQLSHEFDSVKTEFSCLDALTQSNLSEKYLSFKVDIQQKLVKLEDAHNEQQLLQHTTTNISDIQDRCEQVQVQIDLLLSTQGNTENKGNNIDAEVKILTSALLDAKAELAAIKVKALAQAHAQIHEQYIQRVELQIVQQQGQLARVFDVVEYARKGTIIITELAAMLAQQAEQNEKLISQQAILILKEKIKGQKDAFAHLKNEAKDLLPLAINKAFSQVLSKANKVVIEFNDHYKQIENKCDSKLKAVNRMITQGKFKPAMAMFHHVQKMFSSVSGNAPARLQKAFEQTSIDISKLQDWQAYIAQPRKPGLIEQAETLGNSKFEDPFERSHSVKILRQEWNSLGQLHTQEDEMHNKAFDAFIEKAFVPCRAFFAELERQRELNFQQALALIEEVKTLDPTLPPSELASKMGALKTQFNKLGELEKSQVKKVKRDFTKALKPLGLVITGAQQLNAQHKQALINHAAKIAQESIDEAELPEAIEKAKALQQKWKEIGFAGKNIDNDLWHAFRKSNDELFNRFHKNINDKKDAQHAEFRNIDKEINELTAKVKAAKSLSDLQFYEAKQSALFDKAKETDEITFKKLQLKLLKTDDIYTKCMQTLNKQRDESALTNLFAFLQTYTCGEMPDEFEALVGKYKSWVKGDVPKVDLLIGLNREALTQVSAILIDVPYADMPIGNQASRQNLQLQMMAAKLQGDSILAPEAVLATWVSLGPVQANEQDSLQAMHKLFVG